MNARYTIGTPKIIKVPFFDSKVGLDTFGKVTFLWVQNWVFDRAGVSLLDANGFQINAPLRNWAS